MGPLLCKGIQQSSDRPLGLEAPTMCDRTVEASISLVLTLVHDFKMPCGNKVGRMRVALAASQARRDGGLVVPSGMFCNRTVGRSEPPRRR